MLWFLAAVSIVGTVLNARQKRSGFLFWIAANSGWVVVDLRNGLPEQAALFCVYVALAVYGFFAWGRNAPRGNR
jgi:nicotinamide riboside transporter PnuC